MTKGIDRDFSGLARRVAQNRDQEAFTEIFDHFAPRLKAYLLRLGASAVNAEELAQEVMIVLWHRAELFDPNKSSLSTWLFRIARNRRIDALRRDRSRSADLDDPMIVPEPVEPADALLEAEDRDARVRTALTGLPAEQAELLRMAFFLGKTHSEISSETGLPLGTVKSRIRLAFSRMRDNLAQAGVEGL
jgi:RNA polymerase sigma-70 factor, ECF subfamily